MYVNHQRVVVLLHIMYERCCLLLIQYHPSIHDQYWICVVLFVALEVILIHKYATGPEQYITLQRSNQKLGMRIDP
jgi:hypothetical protein